MIIIYRMIAQYFLICQSLGLLGITEWIIYTLMIVVLDVLIIIKETLSKNFGNYELAY
jgi:hypothetical protein